MDKYEQATEIFGMCGRMISASKGDYCRSHPKNIVVFNSNVCTEDGKIWYGDIDVTLDEDKLKQLAEAIGETVYVLYEMDGRFDNEETPAIDKAVWTSQS